MDLSDTFQRISTELEEMEKFTSIEDRSSMRRLGWVQANLEALGEQKKNLEPMLRGSLAKLESRFWSLLDDANVETDPLQDLKADWQKAKTWVEELDQAILQFRNQVSQKEGWVGKDWTWDELEQAGTALEQYSNGEFQSIFERLEESCDPVFWDPSTGEFCKFLWSYNDLVEPEEQAAFGQLVEKDHSEFFCDPEQFRATRFATLEELVSQLYSAAELYNSEYAVFEELGREGIFPQLLNNWNVLVVSQKSGLWPKYCWLGIRKHWQPVKH